jgi:hypothetical protein
MQRFELLLLAIVVIRIAAGLYIGRNTGGHGRFMMA